MINEIKYNDYTAQIRVLDEKRCLSLQDLIQLSKIHYTSIYRVFRKNKFKLTQFLRGTKKRGTFLTLEGCIVFLRCFKFPNDGLIWEIQNKLFCKNDPETQERLSEKYKDKLLKTEAKEKTENLLKDIETIKEKVNKVKDIENMDLSFRYILKQLLKEIIVEEFNKEEKQK